MARSARPPPRNGEALHQRCGLVARRGRIEDGARRTPAVVVGAYRDDVRGEELQLHRALLRREDVNAVGAGNADGLDHLPLQHCPVVAYVRGITATRRG
jgi:hypothetical protein